MSLDLTVLAGIKATLAKAQEPTLVNPWWRQTYAKDVSTLVAALPAGYGEAPEARWVEMWGKDEGNETATLFFKIPVEQWNDEIDGRLRTVLTGCGVTDIDLRHVEETKPKGDIWDRPPNEK